MRMYEIAVCLLALVSLVGAALPVSLSDQGTSVKNISSGSLLEAGNLTVIILNASNNATIYNETFLTTSPYSIINGSWNAIIGENSSNPLPLDFNHKYYKKYLWNGEAVTGINSTGNTIDALTFYSPLGDVDWTYLQNYPSPCSNSQEAVLGIGDTLTCVSLAPYNETARTDAINLSAQNNSLAISQLNVSFSTATIWANFTLMGINITSLNTTIQALLGSNTSIWNSLSGLNVNITNTSLGLSQVNLTAQNLLASNVTTNQRVDEINTSSNTTALSARIDEVNATGQSLLISNASLWGNHTLQGINITNVNNTAMNNSLALSQLNASLSTTTIWNNISLLSQNITSVNTSVANGTLARSQLNTSINLKAAITDLATLIGNWSADKSSYPFTVNLATLLGNWSADKASYTTTANLPTYNNWTSANINTLVGNWSLDKTAIYANQSLFSANITNVNISANNGTLARSQLNASINLKATITDLATYISNSTLPRLNLPNTFTSSNNMTQLNITTGGFVGGNATCAWICYNATVCSKIGPCN